MRYTPFTDREETIVVAMVGQGATGAEIGERLGRSRSSVLGWCRRNNVKLPRVKTQAVAKRTAPEPSQLKIPLTGTTLTKVKLAAGARGQSTSIFLQRLIQTIADSNLFDAVLDDDVEVGDG